MYNENIKNEFLLSNNYSEESINTFKNTFENTSKYEDKLGKDLYDMTLQELEGCLEFIQQRKPDRIRNMISNIKVYSKWAYKSGYAEKESELPLIISQEFIDKFIYDRGDFYLTRSELLQMLDKTPDRSIRACLLAVFEGIGGRGYQELSNIRMKDIYIDNGKWYIDLVNELDGTMRTKHPISDELYKMLYEANETTVFKGMDGEVKYHLIESEYIFRRFVSRRNVNEVDDLIGQRAGAKLYELYLIHFRDAFGILNDYTKFSLKELKFSGLMYYLNQALEEQDDKELVVNETVQKVAERFIFPIQKWKDKEYLVYSKIKGMVIDYFMLQAYDKKLSYNFSRGKVKQS